MQHRSGQIEHTRVAEFGEARNGGAAGVAEAEELGRLVEGLAGSVVQCLAEQRVLADGIHAHQLRVAARDEQRQERKLGPIRFQQGREQMPLQVMHAHQRFAQCKRQRIRHGSADQQRTGQPWAFCIGDCVDVRACSASLAEHFFQQRNHAADVVTRGQFGHHAAVFAVHGDLRIERMRAQAGIGVVQGDAGFVTGGFDAEDQHGV